MKATVNVWHENMIRSSSDAKCEVGRTLTRLGNRSFTVAGLRLWNNLPLNLRDSELTVLIAEDVR